MSHPEPVSHRFNLVGEYAQVHRRARLAPLFDVTGFGLLGHTLGLCRGSGLGASLRMREIAVLPDADQVAHDGTAPEAASALLQLAKDAGFARACTIRSMTAGEPVIVVG